MSKQQVKEKELNEITDRIRQRPYLYLSSFADILGRFQESVLKVPLRFTALSLLVRRGGSLTPTELAKEMFRSKHSITNLLDSLEKEGYIVRTREDKDRRVVHIKLTPEGVSHVKGKVFKENEVVAKVMSSLTEKETDQLLDYLKRLRREMINIINKDQSSI